MAQASGAAAQALAQFLMQWASGNKQDKQFRQSQELETQRYNDGLARQDRQFDFMQDRAAKDDAYRASQDAARAASEATAREDQLGKDSLALRMSGVTGGSTLSQVPTLPQIALGGPKAGGMDAGMLGKALQQFGAPAIETPPEIAAPLMRSDSPIGYDQNADIGTRRELVKANHVSPFEQMKFDADQKFRNAGLGIQRERLQLDRETAANKPQPGVGSAGPANDFERKAAFMLQGAESAAKTLDSFTPKGRDAASNIPLVGNYLIAPETQVAQQAAATLADAYLRLTTGASYGKSEIDAAARQMLPTAGDSDEVKAAKAARRTEVLAALRGAATSNYSGLTKPATSAPANPWRQ